MGSKKDITNQNDCKEPPTYTALFFKFQERCLSSNPTLQTHWDTEWIPHSRSNTLRAFLRRAHANALQKLIPPLGSLGFTTCIDSLGIVVSNSPACLDPGPEALCGAIWSVGSRDNKHPQPRKSVLQQSWVTWTPLTSATSSPKKVACVAHATPWPIVAIFQVVKQLGLQNQGG